MEYPNGEEIHIGKSSLGWCFLVHLYPEKGINSLDDWKKIFFLQETTIKNEYGDKIEPRDMIITIIGRSFGNFDKPPHSYSSWEEFNRINDSEFGPNGLTRHKIGDFCCGHGEGTWDYTTMDFS